MVRRYYRYRRYRRGRYRRYRRRRTRFVNGSSRSTVRVKVPITFTASLTQTDKTAGTQTHGLSPFWQGGYQASVLNSPLYQHYCDLYEEVKCIGMKVRFGITTAIGNTNTPSLRILTAWDRRASSMEAAAPPGYHAMQDYSTVSSTLAVNNSVCKFERSLYASDLLERAQWHDSNLSEDAQHHIVDEAFESATYNINFFSPALFICCQCPDKDAVTVSYIADIIYYFSFRNPRYGGSSENKSLKGLDGEALDLEPSPDAPAPAPSVRAAARDPSAPNPLDRPDDLDDEMNDDAPLPAPFRTPPPSGMRRPHSARRFSPPTPLTAAAAEAVHLPPSPAAKAARIVARAAGAAGAAFLGRRVGRAVQNLAEAAIPVGGPAAAAALLEELAPQAGAAAGAAVQQGAQGIVDHFIPDLD